MGDRTAKPMCTSELGTDWVDAGTTQRTRSCPPGPQQPAKKATHKRSTRPDGERGMIDYDIDCVAASPFGNTSDGQQIVKLLRQWNDADLITYGDTDGDRGHFYGASGIVVNKEYNGMICQTILELVHEATHAIWRKQHPLLKGKKESLEDATANELSAQLNELSIYVWLRDTKGICSPDADMELREQRQKDGTLRSVVEAHEKEQRGDE